MGRGPKKHMKRLSAPKHWMLDKLLGSYAPKPSSGPHKSRECLPLIILLRNRLKYALNGREVQNILMQRLVKVDNRVRTDSTYPAGFMDVISIEETGENFRLLFDVKGRFAAHRIQASKEELRGEEKYKLCKVKKIFLGAKSIPYLTTHDGRTVRYPNPDIKPNDTIQFDLETSKIMQFIKFEEGAAVMITGGRNIGRVGAIVSREKHAGGFEIVHVKDKRGHEFSTRISNVFIIGAADQSAAKEDSKVAKKGEQEFKVPKALISLPRGGGIKLNITEERDRRRAAAAKAD